MTTKTKKWNNKNRLAISGHVATVTSPEFKAKIELIARHERRTQSEILRLFLICGLEDYIKEGRLYQPARPFGIRVQRVPGGPRRFKTFEDIKRALESE